MRRTTTTARGDLLGPRHGRRLPRRWRGHQGTSRACPALAGGPGGSAPARAPPCTGAGPGDPGPPSGRARSGARARAAPPPAEGPVDPESRGLPSPSPVIGCSRASPAERRGEVGRGVAPTVRPATGPRTRGVRARGAALRRHPRDQARARVPRDRAARRRFDPAPDRPALDDSFGWRYVIENEAVNNSGLLTPGFVDWVDRLDRLVQEEHPARSCCSSSATTPTPTTGSTAPATGDEEHPRVLPGLGRAGRAADTGARRLGRTSTGCCRRPRPPRSTRSPPGLRRGTRRSPSGGPTSTLIDANDALAGPDGGVPGVDHEPPRRGRPPPGADTVHLTEAGQRRLMHDPPGSRRRLTKRGRVAWVTLVGWTWRAGLRRGEQGERSPARGLPAGDGRRRPSSAGSWPVRHPGRPGLLVADRTRRRTARARRARQPGGLGAPGGRQQPGGPGSPPPTAPASGRPLSTGSLLLGAAACSTAWTPPATGSPSTSSPGTAPRRRRAPGRAGAHRHGVGCSQRPRPRLGGARPVLWPRRRRRGATLVHPGGDDDAGRRPFTRLGRWALQGRRTEEHGDDRRRRRQRTRLIGPGPAGAVRRPVVVVVLTGAASASS